MNRTTHFEWLESPTAFVIAAVVALGLHAGDASARGHGARVGVARPAVYVGGGHGHWHGGYGRGGVRLGVGIGFGLPWFYGDPYYAGAWYPGVVIVAPPVSYEAVPAAPVPAAKALPDPIFYPRSGQSPAQTEADRQECNRWATTQPSALADASVFHRATMACMEGRGYTAR
jgi:hypothetical protein